MTSCSPPPTSPMIDQRVPRWSGARRRGAGQVDFTLMTDESAPRCVEPPRRPGAPPARTRPRSRGPQIPFADPASKTRVLLIASGKGGVGKSSVTTNLAIALAERGRSVAVVDADVWGYSIPRMLGVDRAPMVIDQMIVPPEAHGVRVMSMGFFVEEEQPVIWRGPMLHKALEQFLTEVYWDAPDYLVIDLPPGTGDVSISLSQYLPRAELYVVTTPQPAAQTVAQRAAFMANKVQLDLKGVIENMSWFTGDDAKRYEIFGRWRPGARRQARGAAGRPVPLVPALREGGDAILPITVSDRLRRRGSSLGSRSGRPSSPRPVGSTRPQDHRRTGPGARVMFGRSRPVGVPSCVGPGFSGRGRALWARGCAELRGAVKPTTPGRVSWVWWVVHRSAPLDWRAPGRRSPP